jgi:hypothetical protein
MRLIHRTLCVIAIAAVTSACGGSTPSSGQSSTATPSPAASPSDPAQAAAQAAKQLTDASTQTATAVPFEALVALLPEVNSWQKGKPKGEQYNMGMTMSRAQVSYTKDDREMDLEIIDSAFNQMALAPISVFLAANYSARTTEGYQKAISMSGHPGWEEWENEPKRGTVTLVVGKRFVVSARGSDLDSLETVRAAVQAVDLGRLATLK